MRTTTTLLHTTILSLALLVVTGCAAAAPSTTSAPVGSDEPVAQPNPTPAVEATPGPDILAAVEFRQSMGIRSDLPWVQAVAANPEAVMDFGVPLLPFEMAEIERRATSEDGVVGAVQAYLAAHPDIAGGLYIDQARGGIVTMLVTAEPDVHEAAVREVIGDAPLAVRQVRWTEAELNDLQMRVTKDQDFLAGIPAFVSTTSTDIIDNEVEVTISSAVPNAGALIAAQVGAKDGQLRVTSDGTGLLLQPTGRIEGRIIVPPGTDVGSLSPQYEADVDIGARDAMGISVRPDGRFVIEDLPPTTYTVTIVETPAAGDNREAGSARVAVPPGGVGVVEIPYEGP